MSYEQKHNEANGEDNRDGADDNNSWNCGVEGPTDDAGDHRAARAAEAQFLVRADVRAGLPHDIAAAMSSAARQRGNNNALLSGQRDLSWYHWDLDAPQGTFLEFARRVAEYRKRHPNFHRYAFYDHDPDATHPDKNIVWFRADGKRMGRKDWENGGWMRTLGMFLNGAAPEIRDAPGQCAEDTDFLLLLNAHHEPVRVPHLVRALPLGMEDRVRYRAARAAPSRRSR